MPELALRCAQFFHSVSEYCVGYYRNCKTSSMQISKRKKPRRRNSSKNWRKKKIPKVQSATERDKTTRMHLNLTLTANSSLQKSPWQLISYTSKTKNQNLSKDTKLLTFLSWLSWLPNNGRSWAKLKNKCTLTEPQKIERDMTNS